MTTYRARLLHALTAGNKKSTLRDAVLKAVLAAGLDQQQGQPLVYLDSVTHPSRLRLQWLCRPVAWMNSMPMLRLTSTAVYTYLLLLALELELLWPNIFSFGGITS